jgi:Protein of unknown function (DUF1176)
MLALSLLAAVASLSPKPGELKSFGDWAVGCDNVRHCTAVSLMEMESGENQLTVTIARSGGQNDEAKLSIANIENRKPGELSLVVDGTVTLGSSFIKGEDDPFEISLSTDAIAHLKAGRSVELRDASGASLGGASLKGVVAALLYMDDHQGRAKSETAMIAKGSNAASSLPAPPPLPVVANKLWPKGGTFTLTPKDIAALQSRAGCDAEDNQINSREAYRLDSRTWLALVPCGSGAYNFSSVPVLVTRGSINRKMKIAEFDYVPGFTEAGGPPLLVNAGWDAATGQLSSYAKGRGLGDCGNAETYVWDGRRFRLISKIAMEECRGVIDWIPVWQAKVAKRK